MTDLSKFIFLVYGILIVGQILILIALIWGIRNMR